MINSIVGLVMVALLLIVSPKTNRDKAETMYYIEEPLEIVQECGLKKRHVQGIIHKKDTILFNVDVLCNIEFQRAE